MNVPKELKIDSKNILYTDDSDIRKYPIFFEKDNDRCYCEPKSLFYRLLNNKEYIIKYSLKELNPENVLQMLEKFNLLRDKLLSIDLPIGYYQEHDKTKGLIVPYYPDTKTLQSVCNSYSIDELSKYYQHDEDDVHNLFLLCMEILNFLEEMVENQMYYSDIHTGNFVFYENRVKLIDFESEYIHFHDSKDCYLKAVLNNYENMIYQIVKRFGLGDDRVYMTDNFEHMRNHVKKLDNKYFRRYK